MLTFRGGWEGSAWEECEGGSEGVGIKALIFVKRRSGGKGGREREGKDWAKCGRSGFCRWKICGNFFFVKK